MGGHVMNHFIFKMYNICQYKTKRIGACGMNRRDEKYKLEG
jgi:hypothetical protein